MRLHELRIHQPFFDHILDGVKRYDIRRTHDRAFAVEDLIDFKEWRPNPTLGGATIGYTGRSLIARIVHITAPGHWGLPADVAVLGIEVVAPTPPRKSGSAVPATLAERAPAISGDLEF